MIQPFSKHTADLLDFFIAGSQLDNSAPSFGNRSLDVYYRTYRPNDQKNT